MLVNTLPAPQALTVRCPWLIGSLLGFIGNAFVSTPCEALTKASENAVCGDLRKFGKIYREFDLAILNFLADFFFQKSILEVDFQYVAEREH